MEGEIFASSLIKWYALNRRRLPWRATRDPYAIWISEVILQQTRVVQGLEYYRRFMDRFPTVGTLAAATEEEVLHLWQGLGYYSRARNLHAAARQICLDYPAGFPSGYGQLLQVKGIGPYTAAAVASIAFGLPHPVLDGNVYRVMARFLLIRDPAGTASGKGKIMQFLAREMDPGNPGDFNQALMELGALVCTPKNPDCPVCPIQSSCLAAKENLQALLPVKTPKNKPGNRYFHYTVPLCRSAGETSTLLRRRGRGDIWQGLYEFPLIEASRQLSLSAWDRHPQFRQWFGTSGFSERSVSPALRHQLTHRTILAMFRIIQVESLNQINDNELFIIVELNQLSRYPVSRLIQRFLSSHQIISEM